MNRIDFHALAFRVAVGLIFIASLVWLAVDAKGCADCRTRGGVWVREQMACVEPKESR